MVKLHETSFSYDYPFPAVTLAYFLRYPNPYSTHVLSTDVIEREFDPISQRLTTTRLHLKRSKLPPTILKLLPKGILGSGNDAGQSYILEKSTIDAKEGWMKTESRNLEWTGILSVIERQSYKRSYINRTPYTPATSDLVEQTKGEGTHVTTTVTFKSRLGQAKLLGQRRKGETPSVTPEDSTDADDVPTKKVFFASWSTSSLQRTIEAVGVRRARDAMIKSKDGMNVVLERLRNGGLIGVLDGMRRDRELAFGIDGPWKHVWHQGGEADDRERNVAPDDPLED